MTGRRAALLLVAAGAVLAFVAYGRPWVVVQTQAAGLPTVSHEVTGRDLEPGAGFLPLLLLAALLALWATSGWWRRAVGVVVVAAGLGVALGAVRAGHPSAGALAVASGLGGDLDASGTAWWLAALLAGLLAAVGGALAAVGGHRWGTMAARYERQDPADAAAARPRSAWEVLDAGGDPTEVPADPAEPSGPPDHHDGDGSGTMTASEPEGT